MVTLLSRIQFAMTVGFHFIFVPMTIGMALFVAILETLYVRRGDERYKTLARFFGKLFTVNFVLGVVTGVTMEFQFGTNWSQYSEFMGDIFGSPLAVEAMMAFFLESTFLSIWIFGWNKVSKKFHLFSAWMVAIGTALSAVWIIVANGFMQHPVGYVLRNGRAEMENFWAVLFNPYAWHTYVHVIMACWTVAGGIVVGVSAWHLLRKQHVDLMKISMSMGLTLILISTIGNAVTGHFNGQNVALRQPAKLAAMEALWETQQGAGFPLIMIPGNGQNIEILTIPGLTSFLAYNSFSAEVKGLKDFAPEELPPVAFTAWSFRIMITLGVFLLIVAILAFVWNRKGVLEQKPGMLKLLTWMIPVPYIATTFGWIVAEVGRQPWTVYGLISTADSVSPISLTDVTLSLGLMAVIYSLLVILDVYLLVRFAKAGPIAADQPEAVAAD